MTNLDLQALQDRIKFDAVSMACCLGISHDQYRHYLYGHSKIPANIERAAMELEAVNTEFMSGLPKRVDERLQKEFSGGYFLSESEAE